MLSRPLNTVPQKQECTSPHAPHNWRPPIGQVYRLAECAPLAHRYRWWQSLWLQPKPPTRSTIMMVYYWRSLQKTMNRTCTLCSLCVLSLLFFFSLHFFRFVSLLLRAQRTLFVLLIICPAPSVAVLWIVVQWRVYCSDVLSCIEQRERERKSRSNIVNIKIIIVMK